MNTPFVFFFAVNTLKDTSGFSICCWASTIMPEASQKVAETAEIPKTAPKTQPKSREKVAETAEIPKTAPKTQPKSRKRPEKK